MRPSTKWASSYQRTGTFNTSKGASLAHRVLFVLVLLCPPFVSTFFSADAAAHDLAFDRVILIVEKGSTHVVGQVQIDPALTRDSAERPTEAMARRVEALLSEALILEIDGERAPVRYETRELWIPGGATPADSVALTVDLDHPPRELRVRIREPLKTLVVTVQATVRGAPGAVSTHSSLVVEGTPGPVYRFTGPVSGSWTEGAADALTAPKAPSAAPLASSRPRTPRQASGFEPEPLGTLMLRYLELGFRHILPFGLDHVLFVLGLTLAAVQRWRALLLELSGFTLAHTITLGLGAAGLVVIPPSVVEPLIALSIAVVGIENLRRTRSRRTRMLVVVGFGLLHGQGFAGALLETGLAEHAFLVSLLSFNLGVELGQLVVVAAALLLLYRFRHSASLFRVAIAPGSLAIAAVGLYWTFTRVWLHWLQ